MLFSNLPCNTNSQKDFLPPSSSYLSPYLGNREIASKNENKKQFPVSLVDITEGLYFKGVEEAGVKSYYFNRLV